MEKEKGRFRRLGTMIDCSRNAVMKPDAKLSPAPMVSIAVIPFIAGTGKSRQNLLILV